VLLATHTWLYVEVLWGIDADPKVSVALVISDLAQPRILSYVRHEITWKLRISQLCQVWHNWKLRTYSYVRSDATENSWFCQTWHNQKLRTPSYVRSDTTESWDKGHQPTGCRPFESWKNIINVYII
jgi:hypothetical protein